MSVKKKIFFCSQCNNLAFTSDSVQHTECKLPFNMTEINVTFKVNRRTGTGFINWIVSHNIGLFLAFMGLVMVNTLITKYLHMSFGERLLESVAAGLAIPYLLNFKENS